MTGALQEGHRIDPKESGVPQRLQEIFRSIMTDSAKTNERTDSPSGQSSGENPVRYRPVIRPCGRMVESLDWAFP